LKKRCSTGLWSIAPVGANEECARTRWRKRLT